MQQKEIQVPILNGFQSGEEISSEGNRQPKISVLDDKNSLVSDEEIEKKLFEIREKYVGFMDSAAQYRKWAQNHGNSSRYGRFYLNCARKLEREAAELLSKI